MSDTHFDHTQQTTELATKVAQARAQLAGMRSKSKRLGEAIKQREQHLIRLEASAALIGTTHPARSRHE